jgi:uncharacterized glyoxalase superfamily metalloenzyme YdcJ
VTAERHDAIRVGSPRELADVADLFAAFGMYPVGPLRPARCPVAGTGDLHRVSPDRCGELARNPFRMFTSMLAVADARFFTADLRRRVDAFLARRQCSTRH